MCDFIVYVSPILPATATPTPTSAPITATPTATVLTASPTPTTTLAPGEASRTPTPTPTISATPTPTISATPTPTPLPVVGEIQFFIENDGSSLMRVNAYIMSGSVHSDIAVNGGIRQYKDTGCTTPTGSAVYFNPGGSNQMTIPSGSSAGQFILQNTGYAVSGSRFKLIDLEVGGNNVTASPQYVTVGSVRYIITGYNVCGVL